MLRTTRSIRIWLLLLPILLINACSSLPPAAERPYSAAFSSPAETTIGRMFAVDAERYPDWSGVRLLDTGREALRLRLAQLETAEHAIDLQYYIWNSDYSGRLLAERILQAADRGVRVRLLLDDFNVGERDGPLIAMDMHPNIEVRIYNPNASRRGVAKILSLIGNFGRLNQRMHNKSFVVDGAVAIIGGRNIGDEYFDLHATHNFRDRDLVVAGPVVVQISAGFDDYWNSQRSFAITQIAPSGSRPTDAHQMRAALRSRIEQHPRPEFALPEGRQSGLQILEQLRADLIWAEAALAIDRVQGLDETDSDSPKQVARRLSELAQNAEQEVLIESAYFILGDAGVALFRELSQRGVKVKALTNSLASNDLTTNHAGYARRRSQMLESGIELFELRPDALSCAQLIGSTDKCGASHDIGLHSKSMVFDRAVVFVGSFNLNLRSVYLNSEIGLIVYSEELATRIAGDIEENMRPENCWQVMLDRQGITYWIGEKNGEQIRYSSEPETGFWRRVKSGLLSLLPIEKYL